MKAILIEVDFKTGIRAGGISPIDPNLKCKKGWQNLDLGLEIREILNSNDSAFLNKAGITVLKNAAEINSKLAELFGKDDDYIVSNEAIMNASIPKNMDFSLLPQSAGRKENLKFLYENGVRGIDKKSNGFDLAV